MAVGPASIYDISATRKRFDVNKQITQLVPDASPFAVFMMRARKKVVDSEKFYWYDEEPAPCGLRSAQQRRHSMQMLLR